MVHDDSHSTLRARADSMSRRSGAIPMAMLRAISRMLLPRGPPKISIPRDSTGKIGINSHDPAFTCEFIPMPALDAIDRKILSLLQTDSRMTMQELADK